MSRPVPHPDPAEIPPAPATEVAAEPARAPATLLPSLAVTSFVLFSTYGAVISVLLPNQVAAVDPSAKVGNLALVSTLSFVFTLFAQPIVGAFSDRTRSGLGRRAPWMLGGAALGAVFVAGLGSVGTIALIAVFWVLGQVALNALQGPMSAVVADRFPRNRRGIASAMIGIGTMSGMTIGVLVAGRLAADLQVGYLVFAVAVLTVTVLFVVLNREPPSRDAPRDPFSWRTFLAGFWVSPRRYPDFAWAFAGRFLFILGYFVTFGFQLFILTDYVGMPLNEANKAIGLLSIAALLSTLVSVPLSGWLSDRFGRRKVFIYGASVVLAIGMCVPIIMPTLPGMILMSAINGIGFGAYMSVDTALMTEVLPEGGAGAAKDLGLLNIATNIPQAMSPAVAGLVVASFGGYRTLFGFGIVVVLLGNFAIAPIRSVR